MFNSPPAGLVLEEQPSGQTIDSWSWCVVSGYYWHCFPWTNSCLELLEKLNKDIKWLIGKHSFSNCLFRKMLHTRPRGQSRRRLQNKKTKLKEREEVFVHIHLEPCKLRFEMAKNTIPAGSSKEQHIFFSIGLWKRNGKLSRYGKADAMSEGIHRTFYTNISTMKVPVKGTLWRELSV